MERRASSSVNVLHCKSTEARATRAMLTAAQAVQKELLETRTRLRRAHRLWSMRQLSMANRRRGQGRPVPASSSIDSTPPKVRGLVNQAASGTSLTGCPDRRNGTSAEQSQDEIWLQVENIGGLKLAVARQCLQMGARLHSTPTVASM
jgi:hypothetical protein